MHSGYSIHVEYHPHQNPLRKRIRLAVYERIYCENPYYPLPNVELPVAFLKTCRQAYHEARNVIYTANMFKIRDPRLGRSFLQRISDYSLTLRSVHLNIHVSKRNDEREWDNTFHELAGNFKTVQNLYIHVREDLWDDFIHYKTLRHSPAVGKRPFLRGLLELKKLPLKTFEISVDEGFPRRNYNSWPANDYSWTPDQKRAWARSIKSAILGKD